MALLQWRDIKPGKSYRIVVHYRGGAVTTFEGRIDDVMIQPTKHALIHWVGGPYGKGRTLVVLEFDPRIQIDERAVRDVEMVEIYALPDPLPERDGAVIMHNVEDGRNDSRKAMLVRVGGGSWVDVEHGGTPRLVNDVGWTLHFMPGQR